MKKQFTILIAAPALFFCGVFSCRSVSPAAQEPGLSVASVEIAEISYSKVGMIAWIDIANPNRFDLPFPEIDWELSINSSSFIRGELKEGAPLRRRRTSSVPVYFSFSYEELYNSVSSLAENREAAYNISLGVSFPPPPGPGKVYRVEYSGLLPLIEVPKISPGSFRIAGIDFSRIELAWDFNVENPNAFHVPFPNMEWEYTAGGVPFEKSAVSYAEELPPLAVSPVEVAVSIRYSDLMRAIPSLAGAAEVSSLLSLNYDFPFSYEESAGNILEIPGTIPVLTMPVFTVRGITRKSLANQKFEFVVNMEIENRNSFGMSIDSFTYEISVNDSTWARGSFENPPLLRANSRTALPLNIVIDAITTPSLFPVIVEIHDIIQRGATASYVCTGDISFSSDFSGLPRLDMPVRASGSSRLLQ